MGDPVFDEKIIERLEALHAIVQANKLTPYSERGDESDARAAAVELRELLDSVAKEALDRVADLIETGGQTEARLILDEVIGLSRFRTFVTLWDVR
jgi:hypothetical protein